MLDRYWIVGAHTSITDIDTCRKLDLATGAFRLTYNECSSAVEFRCGSAEVPLCAQHEQEFNQLPAEFDRAKSKFLGLAADPATAYEDIQAAKNDVRKVFFYHHGRLQQQKEVKAAEVRKQESALNEETIHSVYAKRPKTEEG